MFPIYDLKQIQFDTIDKTRQVEIESRLMNEYSKISITEWIWFISTTRCNPPC